MMSSPALLRLLTVPALLLLLVALLSHSTLAAYPVAVTSVSGCTDVGTGTDNCTHLMAITIRGINFSTIQPDSSLGIVVNTYPDDYLSLFQTITPGAFNLTDNNTAIVALLKLPYPVTLTKSPWENITVGTGTNPNNSARFGPAFRYAAQQPPWFVTPSCSTPGTNPVYYSSYFCSSQSTVVVNGYYLDVVTDVRMSLTANGQLVFDVACTNVSIALTGGQSLGPYWNLTCQLPPLPVQQSNQTFRYPALVLRVSSPYGVATSTSLHLNSTHTAQSSGAHRTHTTGTAALAMLVPLLAMALALL